MPHIELHFPLPPPPLFQLSFFTSCFCLRGDACVVPQGLASLQNVVLSLLILRSLLLIILIHIILIVIKPIVIILIILNTIILAILINFIIYIISWGKFIFVQN